MSLHNWSLIPSQIFAVTFVCLLSTSVQTAEAKPMARAAGQPAWNHTDKKTDPNGDGQITAEEQAALVDEWTEAMKAFICAKDPNDSTKWANPTVGLGVGGRKCGGCTEEHFKAKVDAAGVPAVTGNVGPGAYPTAVMADMQAAADEAVAAGEMSQADADALKGAMGGVPFFAVLREPRDAGFRKKFCGKIATFNKDLKWPVPDAGGGIKRTVYVLPSVFGSKQELLASMGGVPYVLADDVLSFLKGQSDGLLINVRLAGGDMEYLTISRGELMNLNLSDFEARSYDDLIIGGSEVPGGSDYDGGQEVLPTAPVGLQPSEVPSAPVALRGAMQSSPVLYQAQMSIVPARQIPLR